ncbi:hypothetical protein EYC80_006614 [Monilinia laxa]|uniref:DUF7918 domain-containing protein n=1 Tax=Monilinia laxa TaxID=61186 RepID=A0A5N6JUZ0_MONLA|nr:hypothetical protein EYC80_006614 [Monilinia laxa]
MAIMYGDEGEIIVRIKREEPKKCYEEYIKLEPREKLHEKDLQRYIVAELDTTYYVIVALTQGFDFSDYKLLRANLYIDNKKVAYLDFKPPPNNTSHQSRIRGKIQHSSFEVDGQRAGSTFVFKSNGIKSEPLEESGLVQYPPALYLYRWDVLTGDEKRLAFDQLQEMEIKHLNGAREIEPGQTSGVKDIRRREALTREQLEVKELRAWGKFYNHEKRDVFEALQVRQKARARGELNLQYKNMKGEIITFGQESQPDIPEETSPKQESPATAPFEPKIETPSAKDTLAAFLFGDDMDEVDETSSSTPKPSTPANATKRTRQDKDETATAQVENNPFDAISYVSDDDVIFVSDTEWRASKAKKNAEPQEVIKQEAAESLKEEPQQSPKVKVEEKLKEDDNELQELQQWKELEKEKMKIKLDMELLKKEKRLNEINDSLEAVKAKKRKID